MSKPTLGSLFAGIGGVDLGFERVGFQTSWQVEINDFARSILKKNFPHADRSITDVRDGNISTLSRVDVLAGGFPCQDISLAGRGAGIRGSRSGLWSEMRRIISELRPRYVFVENVSALLGRGMDVVLGELSEIGYDAEWQVIPARTFGAPHRRERVFIVAYPGGKSEHSTIFPEDSKKLGWKEKVWCSDWKQFALVPRVPPGFGQWRSMGQPGLVRVDDGIPDVLDRLKSCGNAVVPQVAEAIAGLILEDMKSGHSIK